jgi:hypothetical protein
MHFTMIRDGENGDQSRAIQESAPESADSLAVARAGAGRGRKRAGESRAAEIRARLTAWMQTPESRRVSLRALGAEMGCSHQLLSSYLRGWYGWKGREYMREAAEIEARAKAERRELMRWEEARVSECYRARWRCLFSAAMEEKLREMEAEAKDPSFVLSKGAMMLVSGFARKGVPEAQRILRKCAERSKVVFRGDDGFI